MGLALKVTNLIVCLLLFGIVALPLHEGGHSLAAQCLGVSGFIELDWFSFTGWFAPGPGLTSWQWSLVGFAGGGFAALVLGLLLLFAHIGQRWDEDDLTALRVNIGMQFGYAIGEGLQSGTIAGIGLLLGIIAALAYSIPKLIRWWAPIRPPRNAEAACYDDENMYKEDS